MAIEKFDPDDVCVQQLEEEYCERCEEKVEAFEQESHARATHQVALDIRELGKQIVIGIYCEDCANEVATQVRQCVEREAEHG